MRMKSLPEGALIRSGRFAKAGISTGGNYLRHYLGNSLPIKSFHQDQRTLNRKNALSIFKELSQLRGLPLKFRVLQDVFSSFFHRKHPKESKQQF